MRSWTAGRGFVPNFYHCIIIIDFEFCQYIVISVDWQLRIKTNSCWESFSPRSSKPLRWCSRCFFLPLLLVRDDTRAGTIVSAYNVRRVLLKSKNSSCAQRPLFARMPAGLIFFEICIHSLVSLKRARFRLSSSLLSLAGAKDRHVVRKKRKPLKNQFLFRFLNKDYNTNTS